MNNNNGDNFESSNINEKWLNNIFEQLQGIQNMERMAREGSESLAEYLQIPLDRRDVIIPDAQYQNLKFLVMEMHLLIGNLSPILKEKDGIDRKKYYENRLRPVLNKINDRRQFLTPIFSNRGSSNSTLASLELTPSFASTVIYLYNIKTDIIKDIGHLLYIQEDENKKKW